jgi:hypothetical protein
VTSQLLTGDGAARKAPAQPPPGGNNTMARFKVKLDLQTARQFLLHRGERVGLAVVGTVALLLALSGVLAAMRARSPEPDLLKAARQLDEKIDGAGRGGGVAQVAEAPAADWAAAEPDRLGRDPWFDPGQLQDGSRRNPVVLALAREANGGAADIQVDVVCGPVFKYQLRPDDTTIQVYAKGARATGAGGGAAPAGPQFVKDLEARRLVVVSAAFPYRAQLEVFAAALRKERLKDFGPDDWPRFLGLNVLRWEVRADGKTGRWEWVYGADAEGGEPVIKNKGLRAVLNEAVYDDDNPARLARAMIPGVPVTPLPLLAKGDYPDVRLPGMAPAKKAPRRAPPGPAPVPPPAAGPVALPIPKGRPRPPGVPGPAAPEPEVVEDWVSLDDLKTGPALAEQLAARLKGEIYPFDPSGLPPTSPNARKLGAAPGKAPPEPAPKGKAGKGAKAGPADKAPAPAKAEGFQGVQEKCLVRFLDADVLPGKTYVYAIQVRVANPNYGKADVVAYKQLADVKELPAPWTFTPPVTVPGTWDFYVVDEKFVEQSNRWWFPAVGADLPPPGPKQVAVQVHKWFDQVLDLNGVGHPLGEWLVLERALLHRGEPITRTDAAAEVPYWHTPAARYRIATVPALKMKGLTRGLDFSPDDGEAPVLVDFRGGLSVSYRLTALRSVYDDSAVQLLYLGPDGKLRVRNGAVDTNPHSPRGLERSQRYWAWRDRLIALKEQALGIARKQRPPGVGPPPGR